MIKHKKGKIILPIELITSKDHDEHGDAAPSYIVDAAFYRIDTVLPSPLEEQEDGPCCAIISSAFQWKVHLSVKEVEALVDQYLL